MLVVHSVRTGLLSALCRRNGVTSFPAGFSWVNRIVLTTRARPTTVVRKRPSGFTLIELVVTMMIIGILAVAAISRFSGTEDFDRRGFYDETLAALRYAQKAAIAQRRNVCVAFSATTVTTTVALTIAADAGGASPCAPGTNLSSPTGAGPFVVTPRIAGISFSATPTNFQFDALGRPRTTADAITGTPADAFIATQTFQVAGLPHNITVEQETGYVHP
jgi:MSHA pilin protein MshC